MATSPPSAGPTIALIAAAALALTAVALAQPNATRDNRRVLHEFIEPPADAVPKSFARSDGKVLGPTPASGRNPAGFQRGDKIVPKPGRERDTESSSEVVHGDERSFGADRNTSARPDYQTGADSTLRYVEVFNPSVVPFKRMTALDAIGDDYEMEVSERTLRDLTIGGKVAANRDLFWGSLVVEVRPGEDIAIPSVAPDMRILSYESEPPLAFSFAKDGADNYYVRSDEADAVGTHRLVFLADAPSSYFVATVPSGYRVGDIPAGKAARIPPAVRKTADRVLRRLRLRRSQDLRQAVHVLVNYFRAFEAGSPPPNSGDIYWDLFISQTGVCRHRSFAFAITANALGIPARYVANEAHAWTEIWVPHAIGEGDGHWLRIDLGGSASTLQVDNAADKTMHRPRSEGDLPTPPEYAENYTRLEGDVRGLSTQQKREARTAMPSMSQPFDSGPGDSDDGDEAASEGQNGLATDAPRAIAPGRDLPELPSSAYEGKLATAVTIDEVDPQGFRGEAFTARGRLVDDNGVGMAARRIDLFLAQQGDSGENSLNIGHAVTDADGNFSARLLIPSALAVGDYEVFASYYGDATYRPAVSD